MPPADTPPSGFGDDEPPSASTPRSRRAFLAALGGGGGSLLAGCARSSTTAPRTDPGTATAEAASTPTGTDEPTATGTRTGADDRRVLYLYGDVAADGSVPSGDAEPFHRMRLSDTGPRGLSEFDRALEAAGFTAEGRYDAETTLAAPLLDRYEVVVLGSNQHRFTADERRAVGEWVEDGGGLVAWSDSAFGGLYKEEGVGVCNPAGSRSNNDLTAQFGMTFLRDSGAGRYQVEEYARDHFLNAGDRDGGVVFRGEGVSPVRTSSPATVLARLQSGPLGGRLTVCDADAPYRPERDAALAVATVGAGRVVGTFDRNTFWNAGDGTNLSEVDNREYARRLVRWAAGEG